MYPLDWRCFHSASVQILLLCFAASFLQLPLEANGLGSRRKHVSRREAGLESPLLPLIDTGSFGHYCTGDVLIATSATIMIVDFTFDGAQGSSFYLFKGSVPRDGTALDSASNKMIQVPQADGSQESLRRHEKKTIVLGLRFVSPVPNLHEYDGLVLWNEMDEAVFGYVLFPTDLDVPIYDPFENNKPPLSTVDQVERSLGLGWGLIENLGQLVDVGGPFGHYCFTTGTVLALTVQALALVGFNYDGTGPKAYFYLHKGEIPKNGEPLNLNNTLQIPDEFGSFGRLRKYDNELTFLHVPSGNLMEYDAFIVWCEEAKVLFAYVLFPIPDDWDLPPHETRSVTGGKRR